MKFKYLPFFLAFIFSIHIHAKGSGFQILFEPDTFVNHYVPFDKIEFLDLRHNTEYVGSLQSGVKHSGLVPVFSLDSMLCDFAKKLTDPAVSKGSNTLLVALSEMNLEEKYNGDFTVGNLYMHVDFYLGNDDQYSKVLGIDNLFEFGVGRKPVLDLSHFFDQMFGSILISLTGHEVQLAAPFYTKADIRLADSVFRQSYPVYCQAPKTGVYYSIESFLKNQPDDTLFVQIHNNNFDVITDKFYTSIDGKKKSKSLIDTGCYAVYNGKKWFTPLGNEFKEMKIRNGDFYYMDYGRGLIMPSNNRYTYFPVAGGLLGAVIAAGVEAAAYSLVSTGGRSKMGEAVFRYKLDPKTGEGIKVERLQ